MPIINLTATVITRLLQAPPKTGRIDIRDAKTPGLVLRIGASGAASWSFSYRPRGGGDRRRLTLGSVADLWLADARERAARFRAEVIDGADPQGARRAKRETTDGRLTFDRLCDAYLDQYARPRKASWRNDESYLKRPREAWGDRDAKAITRRDAIALLDAVKAIAPTSANRTQSVLVGMLNWAVEDELLDVNPLAGLRKRAVEKPKERTLSDPEIRLLWRALETAEGTSEDIAAALRVLLLTGQRPGEVAGAAQAELVALDDSDNARWEIPASRMKGRKPQVVPLAPMARQIFADAVARRRAQDDRAGVFASRFLSRATLARHSLSQAFKRVIVRLDPKGADAEAVAALRANPPSPHDLRRTVASGLSALGIPREDRLAVLAHQASDVHGAVYDRYDRLREKRIALAAWERQIAKVLGRGDAPNVLPMTSRGRRS